MNVKTTEWMPNDMGAALDELFKTAATRKTIKRQTMKALLDFSSIKKIAEATCGAGKVYVKICGCDKFKDGYWKVSLDFIFKLNCWEEFKPFYRNFKTLNTQVAHIHARAMIPRDMLVAAVSVALGKEGKDLPDSDVWNILLRNVDGKPLSEYENKFDFSKVQLRVNGGDVYYVRNREKTITNMLEAMIKRKRKEGFGSDYIGWCMDEWDGNRRLPLSNGSEEQWIDAINKEIEFVRYANSMFNDPTIVVLREEYQTKQEELRILSRAQKELVKKINAKTIEKLKIMTDD